MITEQNLDYEITQMVKYIHKYLNENNLPYKEMLNNTPTDDLEWSLIIDQAWKVAYTQALEDNTLSPEERMELEKIQALHRTLKSDPKNRVALNYKVLTTFKHLIAIDNKEDANEKRWSIPKPTPWDHLK